MMKTPLRIDRIPQQAALKHVGGLFANMLQKSDPRYQALFSSNLDGVLLLEPGGNVLAANPEACRVLGYTGEDVTERHVRDIFDLTDPRFDIAMQQLHDVGSVRGEVYFLRVDGTRFPAEWSATTYVDAENQIRAVIIFRDVTERLEANGAVRAAALSAERVVRESEARFRS